MEHREAPITDSASGVKDGSSGSAPGEPPGAGSTGRVVGAVALYVGVRVLLLAVLAGAMSLLGLPVLVSLMIAIVVMLPLSLVLFRPLQARVAVEIEAATRDRRARREELRAQLRGDVTP